MMTFETRGAGRLACLVLALAVGLVADLGALSPAQSRACAQADAPVPPSPQRCDRPVRLGEAGAPARRDDPRDDSGRIRHRRGASFSAPAQDRLYVATANHVVRRGRGPQAAQTIEKLEVKLNWLPGEWAAARCSTTWTRTWTSPS